MKKSIRDIELKGKKVLMRVDFNVPVKDGVITDVNRIESAIPTIEYATKQGAKVILLSHFGRVKTKEDKEGKSLKLVAAKLSELMNKTVLFIDETKGSNLEVAVEKMAESDIIMIENTRFEDVDGKKESLNDKALGKYWSALGDVFINDAFGTAHRSHASNVGIASNIAESAVGLLIEKEIEYFDKVLNEPVKPLVSIVGGAKVSDKIKIIESLLENSDKVIIGGGMTYTFLRANEIEIGNSLCEEDKVSLARELLDKYGSKIVLPIDHVVSKEFSNDAKTRILPIQDIADDEMGLDIGPKSIVLFEDIVSKAGTVVWNGPMGVFEMPTFAKGTIGLCDVLSKSKGITIIGGGDSAAAAIQNGYQKKFSHISTGGGASLEYLEGNILPGIACIQDKK